MNSESIEIDMELVSEFVVEAIELIDSLDEHILALESDSSNKEALNAIFRSIHSIKGSSGFFNLISIKNFSHKFEGLLEQLRSEKIVPSGKITDILFRSIDIIRQLLTELGNSKVPRPLNQYEEESLEVINEILEGRENNYSEFLFEVEDRLSFILKDCGEDNAFYNKLKSVTDDIKNFVTRTEKEIVLEEEPQVVDESIIKEESKEKTVNTEQINQSNIKKTMRIDEETIDGFMSFVGELIVVSEGFDSVEAMLRNENVSPKLLERFRGVNHTFGVLSIGLQKTLMDVRKVSLKGLFTKAGRIARELSRQLGKDLNFSVVGEELKIDKSLAESLEEPLIHMLRNSIDHGIEVPGTRREQGKPECGELVLEAKEIDDIVEIVLKDDGKGIDPVQIRRVAISKGIITEEEASQLSDLEAQNLILFPGFSSAEELSEISGRGVGMDVVVSNIKKVNGQLSLISVPGKGTELNIKLPQSLAVIVISVMVVKVNNERYLIPIDTLKEVFKAENAQINRLPGEGDVLQYRNKIFSLNHLANLFGQAKGEVNYNFCILLESNELEGCITVDELVGIQQVLIKPLSEEIDTVDYFEGTAILGDGLPAIVLNVEQLLKVSN